MSVMPPTIIGNVSSTACSRFTTIKKTPKFHFTRRLSSQRAGMQEPLTYTIMVAPLLQREITKSLLRNNVAYIFFWDLFL